MATLAESATPAPSTSARVWTGRILSGLAIALLLVDAGTKLVAPQFAIDNSPPGLGWSLDVATMRTLAVLLLIPTLLYLWPRTAVLGAILITGYLGGAIATHVRLENPLFSHVLFPTYIAALNLLSSSPQWLTRLGALPMYLGLDLRGGVHFLMQVDISYPELEAERRILIETTGVDEAKAANVLTAARLREIQQLIRRMPVPESVVEAILSLVRSARPGQCNAETDKHVSWGPGPRASQALTLCARARALFDGRLAPSIDDVRALAEPVLQHRMALTFAARAEGMSVRDVVAKLAKAAG